MSNLRIFAPHPEYLLAMKCLAMRLGEEFQDRNDVALLLNILKITRLDDAKAVLMRYYPLERYPVRALYVLEELIASAQQ
jgi:hypothetical protein